MRAVGAVRPALVVGGYTPGLAVIRALAPEGVPVVLLRYDARDLGQTSRWVYDVVECPHPEHDEKAFIQLLASLVARFPGAVLVPASDVALGALARRGHELARMGYVVATASEKATSTCLSKADTYAVARSNGVAVPGFVALNDERDVLHYARRWPFPAALKPVHSHRYQAVFGRKWTPVHDAAAASEAFEQVRRAGLEVLLQELIPGEETCGVNYNAYFWAGEPLVELTAVKVRNSPIDTGSPSVVVSQHVPGVLDPARTMLAALDFRGFANIEFKRDPRDGTYKLIEVNARHNLSAALAYRCGINFPWLQYRHLTDNRLPAYQPYEQGVYWIDLARDAKEAIRYLRRRGYSLGQFSAPYRSPHVFAVWSSQDPRPAYVRALDAARQAAHLTRARLRSVLPTRDSP